MTSTKYIFDKLASNSNAPIIERHPNYRLRAGSLSMNAGASAPSISGADLSSGAFTSNTSPSASGSNSFKTEILNTKMSLSIPPTPVISLVSFSLSEEVDGVYRSPC